MLDREAKNKMHMQRKTVNLTEIVVTKQRSVKKKEETLKANFKAKREAMKDYRFRFLLLHQACCLDSGVTSQMCCVKSAFVSFVEKKDKVMLAVDKIIESPGKGNIKIKTSDCEITLQDVLMCRIYK